MYIVIEGIDTAGKSTQLDILKQNNPTAIFTKEPGGTKIGLELREMALSGQAKSSLAEMFIFLADRAEHIYEIIVPNQDKIIISDRSLISGIAYAKNFSIDKMIELNKLATNNILPSHIVILKLTKDELIKRLSLKKNDSIESRGIEYLLDIQSRLIETVVKMDLNHIIIDANESIEDISMKIGEFLNK